MRSGSAAGVFSRSAALKALEESQFDVCVIGGGITGAGAALDAASRGLRVALLERDDFAQGTSSRSSKLVHGGLRYLQRGEVRLVAEALAERERLRRNAPHLVREMPFLLPMLTRDGLVNRRLARAFGTALWAYDLCGGWRIGKRHRRLTRQQVQERFPMLDPARLACGYLYYDCSTDDARLVLAVLRTAVLQHGAVALNGAAATGVRRDRSGRVQGVQVRTGEGQELVVSARAVLNAGGVWAGEVRRLVESGSVGGLRPAKGVHLTLRCPELAGLQAGLVLPVAKERRSVFVVPWGEQAYVGTTDTDYDGPLEEPRCTAEDAAYLLEAVRAATTLTLGESAVTGSWAGLRPLLAGASSARTADLSRRHQVTTADGVVHVTGGKLTTYRRMARDAVDAVVAVLADAEGRRPGAVAGRCRTATLRLQSAAEPSEVCDGLVGAPLGPAAVQRLAERYGSEAAAVAGLVTADAELGAPLVDGLAVLRAEVVHAARHEMARSVDDVLTRRTGARYRDVRATLAACEEVAALLGAELGWSPAEQRAQAQAYRRLAEGDLACVEHIDVNKGAP